MSNAAPTKRKSLKKYKYINLFNNVYKYVRPIIFINITLDLILFLKGHLFVFVLNFIAKFSNQAKGNGITII